jgi:hypothetical protein
MPKESESTEQIMSEIKVLRRQVADLRGIEQRCQQAEAALKAFDKRNRLLGDSAPLGIFIFERPGFSYLDGVDNLEYAYWADETQPHS